MDAMHLAERVIARYSTCKSYHDIGSVRCWGFSEEQPSTDYIRFETFFEHPERISFSWKDNDKGGTAWSDGISSYLVTGDLPQIQDHRTFGTLNMVAGITRWASTVVPCLLQESFRKSEECILLQPEISLHREVLIDNRSCLEISCSNLSQSDTWIWISVDDFAIRRYRRLASPRQRTSTGKSFIEKLFGANTGFVMQDRSELDMNKDKRITEITYETVQFDNPNLPDF